MAVPNSTHRVDYNGDGSTTEFAVPFYFLANADVTVTHVSSAGTETVWTEGSEYTLTGSGDENGGLLTASAAPSSGTRLVIRRKVAQTQEIKYPANDPFPSSSHEQALDKLTMIDQEQQEQIDRSLKRPVGDSTDVEMTLPAKADRASKVLAFDSGGLPVALSQLDKSADTVTATGTTTARSLAERFAATVHLDDYLTAEQAADAHGFTGSVDVSAALTAAAAAATAGGKNGAVIASAGRYYLASAPTIGKASIIGAGMDNTIFDADGATGGGFSGGAVISFEGGGFTAIPDLASAVSAGANSLSLASAPDLEPGDLILIMEETQILHLSSVSGTFQVGETVTGGTTGAEAIVLALDGDLLTITSPSTQFQPNYDSAGANEALRLAQIETVTGGTSGATANCEWNGGSFNRYRYYYPKGEFAVVERVVGTTVWLAGGLYDSYNTWATLFHVDTTASVIEDCTVRGRGGSFGTVPVRWRYGRGGGAQRVRCENSDYTTMQTRQCFGMTFSGLDLRQDLYTGAASYGFSVANSQSIRITGSVIFAQRHAIAHGGFGFPQNLPNRDIITSDCLLASYDQGTMYAYDIHGNSEYCSLVDSTVLGGCSIGGNNQAVKGSRIFADKGSHVPHCFHFGELTGPNMSISDTYCRLTRVGSSSFQVINVITPTWMAHGGTLSLDNVELHVDPTGDVAANLIQVRYPTQSFYLPKFSVALSRVRQRHTDHNIRYLLETINAHPDPTTGLFEVVSMIDCEAPNAGLLDADSGREFIISGGYSKGAQLRALSFAGMSAGVESIKIDGVHIREPELQGIYIVGTNTDRVPDIQITASAVIDALQAGAQASPQGEGSVFVQYADRLFVDGNTFRSSAAAYETSVGGVGVNQVVWGTNNDDGVKQDFTSLGSFVRLASETPAVLAGDADVTATGRFTNIIYAIAITAARTVTLPASPRNGTTFTVSRGAGATGAFNVDIKSSGGATIKSLTAASQWATVVWYGSNWFVTAQGSL